jgi:phage tail sheath protein FI
MPEYLAPGVFIEEVSYRAKSIEGVSTTTTGFVGPTRYGPVDLEPDIITSLGEFERVYGDRQQFVFSGVTGKMHNYMWHAARAFFEEGGKRLYISRTFNAIQPDSKKANFDDGRADAFINELGNVVKTQPGSGTWIRVSARFPGSSGGMCVRLTVRIGQNVLGADPGGTSTVNGLFDNDLVLIKNVTPGTPPTAVMGFYTAKSELNPTSGAQVWKFVEVNPSTPAKNLKPEDLKISEDDEIRVVSLTVTTLVVENPDAVPNIYSGFALDPVHKSFGTPDSVFDKFAAKPASARDARRLPVIIEHGPDLKTGADVLNFLRTANTKLADLLDPTKELTDDQRSIYMLLTDGNDGKRPVAGDYQGNADPETDAKTGLVAFEDIEDISIVAAPGSTFGYENGYRADAQSIINYLFSHAERMRYRIAVLDSGDDQAIVDVRAMKARIDSKYAAFYYPWVRVLDPVTQQEIHLPPSGFVSGIYARNDVERAVYKAPANEVVRLAIGFEKTLNKAQQEVLNPEGINCFRFFEGRGFRLWGARTTSSDPEWKYVNLRRYFAYLERSIDRGTQWAVFEPNGDALWANVRQTIQDFLFNEWVSGALLGEKPEKAYFVKCDRSTMTQNDLDNGRLVCLIGVAVVKPAEFVIFRIGQWTADRKV